MIDQVIEKIINKIHSEVVTPQMEQIPLNYIMTRKIPDFIKHFFDQEVEMWIREESDKFTSNERFDYDIPEVRVLIDRLFDILKQTANIHILKFNQLLERAIKLESNYLIRPHQTLSQFLFKDSFVITTMDVYDMLKYFDKYQYYKDALTDYFNLKYLREISQIQFEELINEIDQQVFSENPLPTTLKTVKVIVNFVNEGRPASDTLQTDILLNALKDRNLMEYANLVQKEKYEDTEELSIEELELLLRSGKTRKERLGISERPRHISSEKIEDIETDKPEVQVEDITVPENVEIPEEVIEDELEEFQEDFEEELEEEVDEFIEEEEEEEPQSVVRTTAADQLADVVAQKIKGDTLDDLNRLINDKKRKRFIKKIFKRSESSYRNFINKVNSMSTWKEASTIIEDIFYETGINPYSKEAIEFSDIIYNRYFPKDQLVQRHEFN